MNHYADPSWGDVRDRLRELAGAIAVHLPVSRARHDRDIESIRRHVLAVEETVTYLGEEVSAREDAADARQTELIGLIRDHVNALQADNTALREALANADADKAAALEAESEADAGRQEQANAALEELSGGSSEPGESEAPADEL